ncbi:MAG: OB-fold nucleic acid binding domain-containing protein, partial [Lachnospirales bacterium]
MVKATGERTIMDLSIDELKSLSSENKKVTTHGIIHNVRDMGNFAFIIIRKIGGLVQCFYDKEITEDARKIFAEENSVRITGIVREEEKAVNGFEILIENVEVLSTPAEELPLSISKRKLNIALENEIEIRPVTLRNEQRRNVFKLQEGIVRGFRRFLEDNGFTEIFSPKIIAAGAE